MDKVLVIDDDVTFNGVLTRALQRRGFDAEGATNPAAAVLCVRRRPPDRVVLDLNLDGSSGLALIEPILNANPDCLIVVLTGYASIATAVDAVKLGAMQYLAKPAEVDAIIAAFDEEVLPNTVDLPLVEPLSVDRLEWEHIQRVLHEYDGNVSATARALKMHRRTLQRKLSKRPVKS